MRHQLAMVLLVSAHVGKVLGQVQTFPNDYAGFLQAAGSVRTVDFETLPDGTPSAGHTGTQITETFNYDLQGAHFSAPVNFPYIAGNTTNGFSLRAGFTPSPDRAWIIGDLSAPARAVGIFFPGGTTLYAYDSGGSLLGSVFYSGGGSHFFVGLVSQGAPIARVRVDRNIEIEDIEAFVFAPVPEPTSAVLMTLGLGFVLRRRTRARERPCEVRVGRP